MVDRYCWLGLLEGSPVSRSAGYMFGADMFGAEYYTPKPAVLHIISALQSHARAEGIPLPPHLELPPVLPPPTSRHGAGRAAELRDHVIRELAVRRGAQARLGGGTVSLTRSLFVPESR